MGYYGPKTAAAVKHYKQSHTPPILNLALHQRFADDIVGKLTIQYLDDDMVARENRHAPEPKPPPSPLPVVASEKRVSYRKTVSRIKSMSGGSNMGLDPFNMPQPGQPLLDFLLDKAQAAGMAGAVADRVAQHPLEVGDPDFGDEQSRVERQVEKWQVLLKVEAKATVTHLKVSFVDGIIGVLAEVEVVREYNYIYGAGNASQRVKVERTVTTIDNSGPASHSPPKSVAILSDASQPSSYLNP